MIKSLTIHVLICVLFSLFSSVSFAQQGRVKVEIKDTDNAPLEFANLRIFSPLDSTVIAGGYSDNSGLVMVSNVPQGEFYGIITSFGFEDYVIQSIVVGGKNSKVNLGTINMQGINSQELDEVIVRAEKEVIKTSFDKKVYSLEEDMTAQGGDATDILNNIPSVEVDNDGNISLRGSDNVTILIDGRPSAMSSGAEGALDGIPASAIERIELVTNPSAKYDPDGTAGIINIVLKKNRLRGVNTSVDVSAASGHLYNSSINFNVRDEKFNFFANYSFRYREGFRNNMNDRIGIQLDTLINLFQDRSGTDTRRSHTGKIGMDFFIDTNQVVGLSLSGTYNDRIRTGNQINIERFNDEINRYWLRSTIDPRNRKSLDANLDYKYDFRDNNGDFIAIVTQSLGDSYSYGEYEEFYYLPDGSLPQNSRFYQFQDGLNRNRTFSVSGDVQRNIKDNIRYEAGLKAILSSLYRDNYLEYLDSTSGQIIPDENVINEFVFDEDILSAYGIFAHAPGKFKYQLGVRLEQALTRPQLLTTNQDFENNYFSFFPSAHVIYGEKEKGEVSLSYSRRINRPNSWNLNPFPVYSDPLNLRQGNPALQPEYINSFDLGYQKDWDKLTLSSSVYFRQTVDKIQRIRQFFPNGVSVNSFANIDDSYDFGVELIGIYSPFKWWKNVISFNGYETRLTANVNGIDLRNSGFSYSVKLNSTFTLFDGSTNVQVNYQFIAPRFTVQGYYQRFAGLDIGVNRTFLNKNLSIGLRVSDIFDDQGFYLLVSDGPFTQESMYKWETRRLYLSVSYKFGRTEADKSRKPPIVPVDGGDF